MKRIEAERQIITILTDLIWSERHDLDVKKALKSILALIDKTHDE